MDGMGNSWHFLLKHKPFCFPPNLPDAQLRKRNCNIIVKRLGRFWVSLTWWNLKKTWGFMWGCRTRYHTWIFQVCKICAFSPQKPSKRQKFYISGRSSYCDVGVSVHGGWKPPKSSICSQGFQWFSPSILGYHYFRKPPYIPGSSHIWPGRHDWGIFGFFVFFFKLSEVKVALTNCSVFFCCSDSFIFI